MEILKFITAGSVDDGKSTLIGRLLYETGNIPLDEFNLVSSKYSTSNGKPDFSRFTDGLADERAKGITIDVAYRYFFTPKRKYVIADSPGHKEYTRNMFTAASNADLAIILVDGINGVTEQTRRHTYILDFLGIKQVVYAINKMDMVDYQESKFRSIETKLMSLSHELNLQPIIIPISALEGENLVVKSGKMDWYSGPHLLASLESSMPLSLSGNSVAVWVQQAYKYNSNWIALGKVLQGSLSKGEFIKMPGNYQVNVVSTWSAGESREALLEQEAATILLDSKVPIERGDVLVKSNSDIQFSNKLAVKCCYFSETPARVNSVFWIKIAGMEVKGSIFKIEKGLDIQTGTFIDSSETIQVNDFVWVDLLLESPILFSNNLIPELSRGILIDPISNFTTAAFLINCD